MTGTLRARDVVRAVVAEVAPNELPVLDALDSFDDATVVSRLKRRGRRREPLGFGVGELTVMVTPVVWIVLDETIRRTTERIERGLFERWRRRPEHAVLPSLSPEQLASVHRRVLEVAAARGIDEERAEVIAEGVVSRIVLARAAVEDGAGTGGDEERGTGPADAEMG